MLAEAPITKLKEGLLKQLSNIVNTLAESVPTSDDDDNSVRRCWQGDTQRNINITGMLSEFMPTCYNIDDVAKPEKLPT